MDLDQASAFSHYARRVLDADPSSADELAATLDAPFDWARARTAIDDAAAKIDHSLPPPQPVAEGVNAAHGAYVANMCLGCHGPQLAGGRIPGGPPDWPAAPNLTPGAGTAMVRYGDADALLRLFRTGQRPDGSAVKVMPFESLRAISETDVRALHLYLRSLPARPQG